MALLPHALYWRRTLARAAGLVLLDVTTTLTFATCTRDFPTEPTVIPIPTTIQADLAPSATIDAYVVAHQDDWQFFMGDHAAASVNALPKVLIVYVTAGDAGYGVGYMAVRDQAAKASTDTLTGKKAWTCANQTINGHPIQRCTTANVVSYFMRLPDGNSGNGNGYGNRGSIKVLKEQGTPLTALDNSTTYATWADLYSTIGAIVGFESVGKTIIRVNAPDPNRLINTRDHPDHWTTGDAVAAAATGLSWLQSYYVGYHLNDMADNLTAAQKDWKTREMRAYDNVTRNTGVGAAGNAQWYGRTYFRGDSSAFAPPGPPVLSSINLTPDSAIVPVSASRQFVVQATFTDGSHPTVTVAYTTNGGTLTPAGLYTAPAATGSYIVVATSGGKADTSRVTVVPALVSIELTPDTATLITNSTRQFAVQSTYTDGSHPAVTVAYTATGGTITAAGLYTAPTTAGNFLVIATEQTTGKADTAHVTVNTPPAPTLITINMTPDTATLFTNAARQFAVQSTYSDGSHPAVTVTYTTTGGSVTSTGLYTAPAVAGSFLVVAREVTTNKADTSHITVVVPPPTLVSINLSPDTATVQTGATRQFAVQSTFSDGSHPAVSVTYTTNSGTITSAGLYTAPPTVGNALVIATATGGVVDTSRITVVLPPPPPPGSIHTSTFAGMATGAVPQFFQISSATTTGSSWTVEADGSTSDGAGLRNMNTREGEFVLQSQIISSASTDQEILFKMKTLANTDRASGAVLRYSLTNGRYTGYIVYLRAAWDQIEIDRKVDGAWSVLGNPTFVNDPNIWYWVRFRAEGTSIRAKAWADGTPEPANWNVSTTDASIASGAAGLNTREINTTVYDGVSIVSGTSTAPTP